MAPQSGQSFGSVASQAQSATSSAASFLNNFLTEAHEQALDRLMPNWRQEVFGTASQTISDMTHVADRFKDILPELMARTNELSTQALTQVASMLRGEIPNDVREELQRTAAEVSRQIGVRGQAAQYLTARDLGMTSLDLVDRGLQHAPNVTAMAPTAYAQYQAVLGQPMAAAGSLAQMLHGLQAPLPDVASIFSNMASLATNQSQFQTDTANTNYWNQFNAKLGKQAVGVAKDQLGAAKSYNQGMLQLQRDQLDWMRSLQDSTPAGSNTGSGGSIYGEPRGSRGFTPQYLTDPGWGGFKDTRWS